MAEKMTLREIAASWLLEHSYNGLYQDVGCGCEIADLMPCGEPSEQCKAGYKVPCTCEEGHEFDIREEKL